MWQFAHTQLIGFSQYNQAYTIYNTFTPYSIKKQLWHWLLKNGFVTIGYINGLLFRINVKKRGIGIAHQIFPLLTIK